MTAEQMKQVSRVDSSPPVKLEGKLFVKLLLGLAAVLAAAYLCGAIFRDPIVAAGTLARQSLGLTGLFFGVIATDASPLPLTNEPLVILWLNGGVATKTVFLVVSTASVTAGIVGYLGGLLIGSRTPLGAWIKHRYPGVETFMSRYGALGVALCAFLPIPFALSTWCAGMTRIGLARVALASLVRVPKTAFYIWLITTGWNLGADVALAENGPYGPPQGQQLVDDRSDNVIHLFLAGRGTSLPSLGVRQELEQERKNSRHRRNGYGHSQENKELDHGQGLFSRTRN